MFDVLIIGLGAAGYTAAIYCARYKLKTMLIGEVEGGMGITAAEVGNWPGEIEIKGPDLMEKFHKHVKSFEEVTVKSGRVEKIDPTSLAAGELRGARGANGGFTLTLQSGEKIQGKTVILATGSNKRHLGVPGEEEFSGKGVTYCATCDAFFYRNKVVAVIGGGDSAVEGAAIAAQVAKKVYLIHRRKDFRAEPYWVEKVKARDNVTFVLENGLERVLGDQKVTGIQLLKPFEGSDQLAVDGVFIEIGSDPSTKLATELGAEVDAKGYLKVTTAMATNVAGLFAAGDVTDASNHFAQFVTAAGEGSVAANSAFQFVSTTAV